MIRTLAIERSLADLLARQLLQASPAEDGCFCLLHEIRRGAHRRAILGLPIPIETNWTDQHADLLTPSSEMISAAVGHANKASSGLAFVHTHPTTPPDAPSLSRLDWSTSQRLAAVMSDLLDGPFASLVVGPGGWDGAIMDESLVRLDRIGVVGRLVTVFTHEPIPRDPNLDDRQERALGLSGQRTLRSLRVAIIGAGGLGSPVAETLVRMGVGELRLVDNDVLDTPSNARRIFGIGIEEVTRAIPRSKAEAVAAGLSKLGLGTEVVPVVGDIRDHDVQGSVLDTDLLITGTDTHSSRAAAAELSVRARLPLIDIGVRVGTRRGVLDSLRLERRIQVPDGPCLFCWGVLDPDQIRAENLPVEQRRALEQEGYIAGAAGGPEPSVAALTVAAAGVAASAVLGLVAGGLDVAPLIRTLDSLTLESLDVGSDRIREGCVCRRWRSFSP